MFVHRVTTQTYLKRWQCADWSRQELEKQKEQTRRGEEGEQRRRGEFHRSCRHCRPCTSAAAAFLTICILLQLRSLLDSCESAIFLQVESAFWVDCCTALHRQPWASPATPASPPSPRSTFLLHSHSCIPFNAFPAPFAFTPETLCLRWNKSLTTNSLSKQKEQKRRSNYLQRYKYLRNWKYWQCRKYLARYKYLRRRKSYDVANIYNVASTYDAATTYKIACTYMYDVVSTIVGQKL